MIKTVFYRSLFLLIITLQAAGIVGCDFNKPVLVGFSGQLTGTHAEMGVKGLRDLITVSESKNQAGEQKIFTVTNRTANAAGVRQARFVEQIVWKEADQMQYWEVNFTLQEHMSNPERVEKRTDQGATDTGTNDYGKVLEIVGGL